MGFIGLIRLIALLLAAWLVWRFIARQKPRNSDKGSDRIDQKMVQCRVCGTHVPEAEALSKGDDTFCSREHLEASQKNDEPEQ